MGKPAGRLVSAVLDEGTAPAGSGGREELATMSRCAWADQEGPVLSPPTDVGAKRIRVTRLARDHLMGPM
jgi:hypothetical protein